MKGEDYLVSKPEATAVRCMLIYLLSLVISAATTRPLYQVHILELVL